MINIHKIEDFGDFGIEVNKAPGIKCPRCWKYSIKAHYPTDLCPRCYKIIETCFPKKLKEAVIEGHKDKNKLKIIYKPTDGIEKNEIYPYWYINTKEIIIK